MGKLTAQLQGLNFWGKAAGKSLGAIAVSQSAFLDPFPGPAFIVDQVLTILHKNEKSNSLCRDIYLDPDGPVASTLKTVIGAEIKQVMVTQEEDNGDRRVYELTVMRLDEQEGSYLITGQESTMQHNLTSALIASRQLFKDLVTCTREFVWETDEEGCFRYVTPRGAFGYSAAELDGMVARQMVLFGDELEEGAEIPFDSSKLQEDKKIWLRCKDQSLACVLVTSIPVFDEDGNWTGCRGAGRDISDDVEKQNHLDLMAAQEEMLSSITRAIHQEVDADKLFTIAGEGACNALNSTRIWVGRENHKNELESVYGKGVDAETETYLRKWFASNGSECTLGDDLVVLDFDDLKLFVAPIFVNATIDGMIVLVREAKAMDLSMDEKNLFGLIADQLGIALIQIKAREKLVILSRTDELSGLLNRRAFHEDVAKRIVHGKRTKRANALFYIDLDNFKPVNDRFGHEKGDEVLKGVSDLLSEQSRVGDLVSRLGGDEFAMWLEDIEVRGAAEKAEDLQIQCKYLSKKLEILDPTLGFSIGIVMSHGDETDDLDDLLARADTAMYEVKMKGKGTYSIAPVLSEQGGV
jgi:diguanylate cyclase (GGDEF)-like protein/PAS domain S-box-containing protein